MAATSSAIYASLPVAAKWAAAVSSRALALVTAVTAASAECDFLSSHVCVQHYTLRCCLYVYFQYVFYTTDDLSPAGLKWETHFHFSNSFLRIFTSTLLSCICWFHRFLVACVYSL
jgi:hypothetical protein